MSELLFHAADQSVPYVLTDSIVVDEIYEIKIENIYDPSKFWIVLKIHELKLFMKYLKDFYSKPENRESMSRDILENKLICMVFRNNMYYRCMVQPVLLPDTNKIRVFLIDYGLIINVSIDDVFCIFKKHCKVPRFAIRTCLADLSPVNKSRIWSQTDLKSFCALIEGRPIQAKICEVDTKRGILFVDIRVLCGKKCESINMSLFNMRVASYKNNETCDDTKTDDTKYIPKVKYLHFYPTFEALENGIVPCSLWEHDLLKNSVPLDLLYKNYYMYQGGGNDEF